MNYKRRKRLSLIIVMVLGASTTVALVLYALNNNINLYYTPEQINSSIIHQHRDLRLGGMVMKGSVHHLPDSLNVTFRITDYHKEITVKYSGVLPALFREGQGVVTEGQFENDGSFVAKQVLAKHDEKYMPPNIPLQNKVK